MRVFCKEKRATKDKAIIIVFIEPTKNRNCLGVWGIISEPITAACPEPRPGRTESGAEIEAAAIDLRISFFVRLILDILAGVCGGRTVLFLMETMRPERPKSPVNKGKRGSLTGRFNVRKPRKHAKKLCCMINATLQE